MGRYCAPRLFVLLFVVGVPSFVAAQEDALLEANKRLARDFYQDLWFTRNTDRYDQYLAPEYTAHDIGDRKGMVEPAIEQKNIADFLWRHGEMSGKIDYQIAEGDLVATRWQLDYQPTTLLGRFMMSTERTRSEHGLPIINVFRIRDGRIVELWNHRHDIDTGRPRVQFLQGLGIGLAISVLLGIYAFVLRRRLRREKGKGDGGS